jgi:hypothetical protein
MKSLPTMSYQWFSAAGAHSLKSSFTPAINATAVTFIFGLPDSRLHDSYPNLSLEQRKCSSSDASG